MSISLLSIDARDYFQPTSIFMRFKDTAIHKITEGVTIKKDAQSTKVERVQEIYFSYLCRNIIK